MIIVYKYNKLFMLFIVSKLLFTQPYNINTVRNIMGFIKAVNL